MGEALRAVLGPLARLALAKGVPFAVLEEMLKETFVDEALKAQPAQAPSRLVSRISVATGLNRREVTRLTREQRATRAVRQAPAAEVFARWQTDPLYLDEAGVPRALPRVAGPAGGPSFESLAQGVTRDVHPRSLLDELCRLGVACLDAGSDEVSLLRNAFVPSDAQTAMLGFLGDNVGDHLAAAVSNVLAAEPPHFEQAVFADELSAESIERMRGFVLGQWTALMKSAVPMLEDLIEEDRQAGRPQDRRLRIGLYSYAEVAGSAASPIPTEPNRE
ncbi:MAG: hypothetical protein F9K15_19560 [Zoogloea sp.]|nr:MAG: hypothetical protein F9K15_19560 [Zoogloea sp.]